MACGEYPQHPFEYWMDWRLMDGVVCYYGDQIGVLAFMFLFFGVTFVSLYQATGSVMLPLVVLIALGPLVILMLPALGIQFVIVLLILGLGLGGFYLWMRIGAR